VSTVQQSTPAMGRAMAVDRPARRRPRTWRGSWWRHVVGVLAIAFALFPPAYVVSAAFTSNPALSATGIIPENPTLANFRELFAEAETTGESSDASLYGRWYANTLIVAAATAILTVLLGAFAAYAFSRFRFRGRRVGMLFLLLIQMFPALLLVVAIYLIILRTGDIFGFLGLNTLTGLILVYLGGSMGVQTWLLKGFFDTIPQELDESARVDGATPGQIFWGVVLPLAAPVLAVVALLSFVGTINEFVIASVLLQDSEMFT